MPTVILLDVSLSMSRPVPTTDTTETHTRLTIAAAAINTFLDYLCIHAKLEYVGLVTFSSVYEVAVPFTREFDNIRVKLPLLEEGDKTCIETALHGVNQLILTEWGYQTPVQIILITDGSTGVGAIGRNRIIQALPLPPTYPGKIHILPVVSPHDPCLQHAMPLYQKIVDLASNTTNNSNCNITRGAIYCPDQLSVPGEAEQRRIQEQRISRGRPTPYREPTYLAHQTHIAQQPHNVPNSQIIPLKRRSLLDGVEPRVTEPREDKMLSVSGRRKCSHCGEELGRGAAMIIEPLSLCYHVRCFTCAVCGAALGDGRAGADVRVRARRLHCHHCYSADDGSKYSCV